MEIAGLAIGVVGLLALYQEAAGKIHSIKHFSSESLRLTARYNATKILFERWGQQLVIANDRSWNTAEIVHWQLNDQATVSTIADLLKTIGDIFASADAAFTKYQAQQSEDLGRLKSRLKWAAGDSNKLSRQVEDFDDLVQKLYLLILAETLHNHTIQGAGPNTLLSFRKLEDAIFESQRSNALDRIMRWLDAASTEDSFDAYCSARLDTTCNWITSHPTYQDWLYRSRNTAKTLWIHGPPGFGKSVLCAHIIQSLQKPHLNLADMNPSGNKSR
ncbi:hypothetical protein BDW74DRAFT_179259 [Aspergillus multicolor]|uniref:uncharacterized protein n=1 Tax=Aspergillus multicolor TaxID=41759 RepID=UPI003CCE0A81